jgi:hypothetical protein
MTKVDWFRQWYDIFLGGLSHTATPTLHELWRTFGTWSPPYATHDRAYLDYTNEIVALVPSTVGQYELFQL